MGKVYKLKKQYLSMTDIDNIFASAFRRDIFLYVMKSPGVTPGTIAKAIGSSPQSISRAISALNGFLRFRHPKGVSKKSTKLVFVSVRPVFDLIFKQMGDGNKLNDIESEIIDKVFFHPLVQRKTSKNFSNDNSSSSIVMTIMMSLNGLAILRESRNRNDIQLYRQFEHVVEKHAGKKLKGIIGI